MDLSRFPRVALCHRPTPLEPLRRLSGYLAGPNIYVKRDDCTGLALGGNKARKLEFLVAEALAQDCDTLVTIGGLQSNHCRQTAAAAALYGLGCELILPHLSRFNSTTYETSGNVLLDQLFGASLHVVASMDAAAECSKRVLDEIRDRGGKPYFIPAGGSTALGALGYVDAARELAEQAAAQQLQIDHVIVTTGSSTTHAGLVVGFHALELTQSGYQSPPITGISVYQRQQPATALVRQRARETAELLGVSIAGIDERVLVTDAYLGRGYGEPTDGMIEAVQLTARLEGLLLDPVYTGKTMAGLIDRVRQGSFRPTENIVFMHTGGMPALFAYRDAFASALGNGSL
jgi:L-cysteate sulfo-lyase